MARYNGMGVCVLKWRDKREVTMISSEYGHDFVETVGRRGRLSNKPRMVDAYNKHMGGIDKADQLLSYYI